MGFLKSMGGWAFGAAPEPPPQGLGKASLSESFRTWQTRAKSASCYTTNYASGKTTWRDLHSKVRTQVGTLLRSADDFAAYASSQPKIPSDTLFAPGKESQRQELVQHLADENRALMYSWRPSERGTIERLTIYPADFFKQQEKNSGTKIYGSSHFVTIDEGGNPISLGIPATEIQSNKRYYGKIAQENVVELSDAPEQSTGPIRKDRDGPLLKIDDLVTYAQEHEPKQKAGFERLQRDLRGKNENLVVHRANIGGGFADDIIIYPIEHIRNAEKPQTREKFGDSWPSLLWRPASEAGGTKGVAIDGGNPLTISTPELDQQRGRRTFNRERAGIDKICDAIKEDLQSKGSWDTKKYPEGVTTIGVTKQGDMFHIVPDHRGVPISGIEPIRSDASFFKDRDIDATKTLDEFVARGNLKEHQKNVEIPHNPAAPPLVEASGALAGGQTQRSDPPLETREANQHASGFAFVNRIIDWAARYWAWQRPSDSHSRLQEKGKAKLARVDVPQNEADTTDSLETRLRSKIAERKESKGAESDDRLLRWALKDFEKQPDFYNFTGLENMTQDHYDMLSRRVDYEVPRLTPRPPKKTPQNSSPPAPSR